MVKKIVIQLFTVIILLLVLQIAGVLLNKFSPVSILFHQALVGAAQTIIICWFFLSIIIEFIVRKSKKPKSGALIAAMILALLIAIIEILSASWLKNPQSIPGPLRLGYRLFYQHNQRNIIQVVPECSEYSKEFFYNLKPNNTCTYSNNEFSNRFATNRMGFRDDDTSLQQPEIVCLGDSYMLGWGVEQNEAIPSLLEKATGKRVLNAAMSSFGTVREMMRYKLVDTSAIKTVVLQYCFNDNEENKAYFDHGKNLPISSRASYDSLGAKQDWNRVYFPGKYSVLSLKYLFKERIKTVMGRAPSHIGLPINIEEDARMFLDVLATSSIDFNRTRLIVFVGDDIRLLDHRFEKEVEKLVQSTQYKDRFKGNLVVLDLGNIVNEEDYYILDEHFNAAGHKKIAEAILNYIR